MFNSVNNPFGQRIESAISTGQEHQHKHQNQQEEDKEKKYLENDERDEVQFAETPSLSEDEIINLLDMYIAKLKSEHQNNTKIQEKLDKYLAKFNVKKFMKQNPNMSFSDFNIIMFNETTNLLH